MTPMRLLLFAPAHEERFIHSAHHLQQALPIQVVLDLEDGCPVDHRVLGRQNVRAHCRSSDLVRVTRDELEKDLAVLPPYLEGVIVPKATPDDAAILPATRRHFSIIETALGLEYAREIARFSEGLIVGLGDLPADLGSDELNYFAELRVLVAGRAHGIPVFSSPSGQISGPAVRLNAIHAYAMGYDGVVVLHPQEARETHAFARPTDEEIEAARQVLQEPEEVHLKSGHIAGPPHVRRAERLLKRWTS